MLYYKLLLLVRMNHSVFLFQCNYLYNITYFILIYFVHTDFSILLSSHLNVFTLNLNHRKHCYVGILCRMDNKQNLSSSLQFALDYYYNKPRGTSESSAFFWWLNEYPMWIGLLLCVLWSGLPVVSNKHRLRFSFILQPSESSGWSAKNPDCESDSVQTSAPLRPRNLPSKDKTLVFILLSSPHRKLESQGNS